MKLQILFLSLFFFLSSCVKEKTVEVEKKPTNSETGKLVLEIQHFADDKPFALNTEYTTTQGDLINIEAFNYYLSNIRLRRTTDLSFEFFAEPESYHLFKATQQSTINKIEVLEVPIGTYDQIDFAVGVDNGANLYKDKLGDLDPNDGMAWDWKDGYKFLVVEGKYKNDSGQTAGFVFHYGTNANYHQHRFQQTNDPIIIEKGKTTKIKLDANFLDLFSTPYPINLDTADNLMFGALANKAATNYSQGFFKLNTIEIGQ